MARPVDPARHRARRLQIIDAALTRFAADGYAGATTAAICRTAGIGSGTFFHYFPTKLDVLLAILRLGASETADWFAAQQGREDPVQVLHDYVDRTVEELTDPRVPGFVRSVGAVLGRTEVTQALRAEDGAVRAGLTPWVERAQASGSGGRDLGATEVVSWVQALLSGFTEQVEAQESFEAREQQRTLHDLVDRLLA